MPRDDVTALIADNLGSMPHPDGRPRRFMHHSQFAGGANDAKVQVAVRQLATDHAVSVQHLLERKGYEINHKDDPRPADAEGYKTAHIKCARCGRQLLEIGLDHSLTAQFSPLALRSVIAALSSECPAHD